jgi:hypothetical protein
MAHPDVMAAVEQRLAELWTNCPVVGINGQGEAPQDGSAFMVVQYPVSNQTQIDLAEKLFREEGTVRFVINTERGAGVQQAKDWAAEIGAMFRRVRVGRVRFELPSSPFFDDSNDAGNYFTSTVVVDFWLTYQG